MELTRALLALALAGAAAGACRDGTMAPAASPTILRVDLRTPNPDDGAVIITLRGPGMSNVASASSGYLAYTRVTGPEETRVIVVGDLKAGALVTLEVAPGHARSDYTATVQQVAARSDRLRDDLTGYDLSVTVP
jgi:hypothetical protein